MILLKFIVVVQLLSCVRLFGSPMNCSMPGVPVLHYLPESESEIVRLCPTLCDPMDCSLPDSLFHEIFQARILEWVAISFSITISLSLLKLTSMMWVWSHHVSQWCHPTTSSSVAPFSSCPQSFPASGSFQMSWLFASGGQSTGASASVSVLPMNIQGWFPSGVV